MVSEAMPGGPTALVGIRGPGDSILAASNALVLNEAIWVSWGAELC